MPKKWNVMVYQAGDNNLGGEMIWALQEIKAVGPSPELEVRVQFDPIGGPPQYFEFPAKGMGNPPSGYPKWHIMNGLNVVETAKVIADVKKTLVAAVNNSVISGVQMAEYLKQGITEDSSSPLLIKQFIDKTSPKFGDNYMLILSGHGSGALGGFLKDNNPIGSISIPRLGGVLKGGKTIQILGMDSCNMSMAEVCYEVRASAEYLVGSEGFMLNSGWPYGAILSELKPKMKNNASTVEVVNTIVEEYIKFYTDYAVAGVSVDLSAVDLKRISRLVNPVSQLVTTLRQELKKKEGKKSILVAHCEAQSYSDEEYVDLWDFCDRLQKNHPSAGKPSHPVQKKSQLVKDQIDKAVIKSCYSGPAFQYSHGLSVYFPWTASDSVLNDYAQLEFPRKSKWVSFLKEYITETRRDERNDLGLSKKYRRESPLLDETMLLIRKNPPFSRGGPPQKCKVKNFPEAFFPSICEKV